MTIFLYIIIIVFILYVIVLIVAGIIDYSEFRKESIEITRVVYRVIKTERLD